MDPDNHHLWASLGCAAENIAVAATAYGLEAVARFVEEREGRVEVTLEPGGTAKSPLLDAIASRQSTRSVHEGPRLTADERGALTAAASRPSVEMRLVEARDEIDRLRDLVIAAHVNQAVEVPQVRAELSRHLGLKGGRPSLIVRLGRARPLPYSLRRPPEQIAPPA